MMISMLACTRKGTGSILQLITLRNNGDVLRMDRGLGQALSYGLDSQSTGGAGNEVQSCKSH
jgi:hypothetical protein